MAIVNFLIESLLITNIWIVLYNHLLRLLNSKFPSSGVTNFIIKGVFPEPFEIPLYIVLSFFMVIIVYFFHKKINVFINYFPRLIKLIFLSLLFLVFVNRLGQYPMGKDLFPLLTGETDFTNKIYLISYLGVIAFLMIESGFLSFFIQKKSFLIIYLLFIIGLIAFLTITPGFPISWHDYPYFWGPVMEIVHGKTIYTQIQSQYGFLAVIIPAILYRFHLINLSMAPIVIWLLYIVEYFLCFYLIYKLSRSLVLALIGLFSLITVNYYSLCCNIAFPQIGPLRWLPMILLIFLFYKLKKIDSYLFIFILSLLSFWIVDVGIAIVAAYTLSLLLLVLVKSIDLKKLIKDYLFLGVTLLAIFLIIDIVHFILGYQPINVLSIFSMIREFSRVGYGMLPIPAKTYFYFTLLIYFSSIIYFFRQKNHRLRDQLLLFSANLTLFASIYYVGRSHPLNLFIISLFSLLTIFIFISGLYSVIKSFNWRLIVLTGLFFIFVAAPAYARKEMLAVNLKQTLTKLVSFNNPFNSGIDDYLNNYFQAEKDLIHQYLKEDRILILSTDDTYLLYLTNKASLLNINPLTTAVSQNDIEYSLQRVYQICPKKIAVDCEIFGNCPFFWKLNYLRYPYQLFIDKINQHCHFQYKPIKCTNQLCIASAKE